MEPFETLSGKAVPLDVINVDTDQIIPKQFLKKIDRVGFGDHLFHDWRYIDDAGKKGRTCSSVLDQDRCVTIKAGKLTLFTLCTHQP